jgi:WD40 repeat protein
MLTPMTGMSRQQLSTNKSSPKRNETSYDGSRQKSPKTYQEDPTYDEEETPIEDLLFIGSSKGQLIEWSITQQRRVKNFGEFTSSEQLIMTTDNAMRNLFIIGSETQNLAQMDLCDNDQIVAWGQVHENSPVHLLVVSPDDEYLLSCDESSRIKQWLIKDQTLVKDFGNCSETQINTLLITHHPLQPQFLNSEKSPVFNIFTCDDNGKLRQWCLIKNKKLQIDWKDSILYPQPTPGQYLFPPISKIQKFQVLGPKKLTQF